MCFLVWGVSYRAVSWRVVRSVSHFNNSSHLLTLLSDLPPHLLPRPRQLSKTKANQEKFHNNLRASTQHATIQPRHSTTTKASQSAPRAKVSRGGTKQHTNLRLPTSRQLKRSQSTCPRVLRRAIC